MEGLLLFALALVGFGFVVVRPEWGAPYFAFLLFMRYSDVIRGEFGVPSLFMILAPALLLIAIGRWLFSGDALGRGWRPALWLLLLYGAVCAASLTYASQTDRTSEALLNYADGIVIVLVMTFYLRTPRDLERTVWALIGAAGILASLAVWQQLTGSFDDTYAGFSRAELRNIFNRNSGYRSEGPVSANYFALILVAVVPLAVERLLHARGRAPRLVAGFTLVVSLATIVFTYSRGGLVALAMCCVPMLIWLPRRYIGRSLVLGGLLAAVLALFVLPADYMQRLGALTQVFSAGRGQVPSDSALRGRLSEVTSAAMIFSDHPVVGVGYGNFEVYYPRYAQRLGLDGRREERQAHSLYLEVAAETGIVGLLTFGALIGGAGMGALRARRSLAEAGEAEAEKIATGFGIALLGYLAGSIFLHLTYPRYFWLLLGIGLGMYALAQPMRAPARRIAATPVAQGTG
jgi:O-antigen ligase